MESPSKDELNARLEASEARVDARLANFDGSIKTGFAELRAEFAGMRTEMANARMESVRQTHESLRWIITAVFAMLSISVAVIGVMINYAKVDKTPTVQAAPVHAASSAPNAADPGVVPPKPAP